MCTHLGAKARPSPQTKDWKRSIVAVHFPGGTACPDLHLPVFPRCSSLSVSGGRKVYFEKIRVFKAGKLRLYNVAWNNGMGH